MRFALLILTVLLVGCTKEDCDSINCLNGGICNEGICECPEGYTGSRCETFNPCYVTDCENGGECENGHCECLPGYFGVLCENQLLPAAIYLRKLDLLNYPEFNAQNLSWDMDNGPDLYFIIGRGSEIVYESGNIITDAIPGKAVSWIPIIAPSLVPASEEFYIAFFDDDGLSDELVARLDFHPYTADNDFPEVMDFGHVDTLYLRLEVEYAW
jgi:hypothetical protein